MAFPPIPDNIVQMGERLAQVHEGNLMEYNNGRMRFTVINDSNGYDHILFSDLDFVRSEFHQVQTAIFDATFNTTPLMENAYHILTIMGIRLNHVSNEISI